MSRNRAIKYIETIQKETWKRVGGFQDVESLESTLDEIRDKYLKENHGNIGNFYSDEIKKEALDHNKRLLKKYPIHSKYQNVHDHLILVGLQERLENASLKGLIEIPTDVIFGTIPAGTINAYTGRFDDGSHVVLIQRGLFYFINLTVKIAVQMLPLKKDPGSNRLFYPPGLLIAKGLEPNSDLWVRFFDLLESYIIYGDPLLSIPYLERVELDSFFEFLLTGAELFALSHEYAHILLGHTAAVTEGQDIHSHGSLEELTKREISADRMAAEMVIKAFDNEKFGAYWGIFSIFIFFWSCSIVEEALVAIQEGKKTDERGPNSSENATKVDQMISDVFRRTQKQRGKISLGAYPSPEYRLNELMNSLLRSDEIQSQLAQTPWLSQHLGIIDGGFKILRLELVTKYRDYHSKGVRAHQRILPLNYPVSGSVPSSVPSTWKKLVTGFITSNGGDKRFFLRNLSFHSLFHSQETYYGLLDDDRDWAELCEEFLKLVQPLYKHYIPRLRELLTKHEEDGTLDLYIMRISASLSAYIDIYAKETIDDGD